MAYDLWQEIEDRIWLTAEGMLCIDTTLRDILKYEGIDEQRLKACVEDNELDDTDKGGERWINWDQVKEDYEKQETSSETKEA